MVKIKKKHGIISAIFVVMLVGTMFVYAQENGETNAQPIEQNYITADGQDVKENKADEPYEEPDIPITGSALDQASEAALGVLGEGLVTETEVGDEESYYEVEVTLNNGREVDVQLDENFNFVGFD